MSKLILQPIELLLSQESSSMTILKGSRGWDSIILNIIYKKYLTGQTVETEVEIEIDDIVTPFASRMMREYLAEENLHIEFNEPEDEDEIEVEVLVDDDNNIVETLEESDCPDAADARSTFLHFVERNSSYIFPVEVE